MADDYGRLSLTRDGDFRLSMADDGLQSVREVEGDSTLRVGDTIRLPGCRPQRVIGISANDAGEKVLSLEHPDESRDVVNGPDDDWGLRRGAGK